MACPFPQDPLPYLAQYPDADILTSSDQVVPTVVDDRLADWKQGKKCLKLWPRVVLLLETCSLPF